MTVNVSPSPMAPVYTGKITAVTPGIPTTGIVTFSGNFPVGNYIIMQNQKATLTVGSMSLSITGNGFGNPGVGGSAVLGAPQYFYNTTGSTTATANIGSLLAWTNRLTTLTGDVTGNSANQNLIYGNNIFVVVGGGNPNLGFGTSLGFPFLGTSTDGITWTTRNSGFGTSNGSITGVAYLSTAATNKYLAGGYAIGTTTVPIITTSTDGITWTTRNPGFGTSIARIGAVVAGNAIYVAAGYGLIGANAMGVNTSTDGVTWTVRTSTPAASGFGITNPYPATLIYGAGKTQQYVMAGMAQTGGFYAGYVSSSTDAITWSTRYANNLSNDFTFYHGGFGLSVYAIGFNTPNVNLNTITSTDGITWTTITNSSNTNGSAAVNYANGYLINARNGQLFLSTDGINWSSTRSGITDSSFIAYGTSIYAGASSSAALNSAYMILGELQTDYYVRIEGPSPVTTIL